MIENNPAQKEAEARLKEIVEWLRQHAQFILSTDRVKLEINIKGKSVKGNVTQFPE